jgi:uncharacterized protein YjbI with pentapeptide repeats
MLVDISTCPIRKMANPEHLALLENGIEAWNDWRQRDRDLRPDLSAASLEGVYLRFADLSWVNLSGANLTNAMMQRCRLIGADLKGARLDHADLTSADLQLAVLSGSQMHSAKLTSANLANSRLVGTDLRCASLILANMTGTDVTDADLHGCSVYGLSAWKLHGQPKDQSALVISRPDESIITVDKLEVAQFIYLLLNNENIRHVIDTITSKVVLILGRFMPDRKMILDAIRDELSKRGYLPVLFDFEKPSSRDITETVSTLAHMARFVIADITDARSIPQELMAIVPALPSVPVQPLLLASQQEYGMFEHFRRFPWVLEPFLYADEDQLIGSLESHVVGPAEKKAKEQTGRVKS